MGELHSWIGLPELDPVALGVPTMAESAIRVLKNLSAGVDLGCLQLLQHGIEVGAPVIDDPLFVVGLSAVIYLAGVTGLSSWFVCSHV